MLKKRIRRINEKIGMTSSVSAEQAAEQLAQINAIKEKIRALRKREPSDSYEEAIRWLQVDATPIPALRRRLRDKKVATDKGLIRAAFSSSADRRIRNYSSQKVLNSEEVQVQNQIRSASVAGLRPVQHLAPANEAVDPYASAESPRNKQTEARSNKVSDAEYILGLNACHVEKSLKLPLSIELN